MKYIIEFHDEPELIEEGVSYYKCVDVPWFSLSDQIIGKLTPYTEGEEYKQGTSDAWDFARHLNGIGRDIVGNIYFSMRGNAVRVKCVDTGEEFRAVKDAAEKVEVSSSSIFIALRKGGKYRSGGYRWERI